MALKTCPTCQEKLGRTVETCPFCGHVFENVPQEEDTPIVEPPAPRTSLRAFVFLWIFAFMIIAGLSRELPLLWATYEPVENVPDNPSGIAYSRNQSLWVGDCTVYLDPSSNDWSERFKSDFKRANSIDRGLPFLVFLTYLPIYFLANRRYRTQWIDLVLIFSTLIAALLITLWAGHRLEQYFFPNAIRCNLVLPRIRLTGLNWYWPGLFVRVVPWALGLGAGVVMIIREMLTSHRNRK